VNGCVAAVARRSARGAEEWLRRYKAETSGIQFGDASVSERRSAPFSDRPRT